jgi:hypothetical protein
MCIYPNGLVAGPALKALIKTTITDPADFPPNIRELDWKLAGSWDDGSQGGLRRHNTSVQGVDTNIGICP